MAGQFIALSGDQVINAKQRIQYVSTTRNLYGLAAPGTATSAAGWQIREEILDSQDRTTEINFAGGTLEFIQVWDDRLNYSYS